MAETMEIYANQEMVGQESITPIQQIRQSNTITMKKPDMVNHPTHYQTESGLEVIDIIAALTEDLPGILAVDTGNAIKYLARWSKKNGVEDLKKARWYIDHLITKMEE